MARTGFETTTNLRVTHQSAALWLYAIYKTFFGKFIGPMGKAQDNATGEGVVITSSDNALCQLRMELSKGAGDKVTFGMAAPLIGAGTVGDDDLEGNEEEMSFYDFSMELFAIAHAVRGVGDLSDKRVAFDVKQKAREALTRWMGVHIDNYTLMALSGLASADGNLAAVAPAADRRWIGGQTSAGVVDRVDGLDELNVATNFLMGPAVIRTVKRMAQMADPVIRPIMIDGEPHYVMFIHTYAAKALKATDEWKDMQYYANVRGKSNPLFSGSIGMVDAVILHEWERIETRYGDDSGTVNEYFDAADSGSELPSGIYAGRNLFCGAQAVCQAFARKPKALAKPFDYNRKWGVGIESILSVAKPVFNSLDYGVIAVDTCHQPDE